MTKYAVTKAVVKNFANEITVPNLVTNVDAKGIPDHKSIANEENRK